MLLAGRIVPCALGLALLWLGAFVYEDEERQLQNRIEEWWIRLDDLQQKTVVVENKLLRNLFRILGIILDAIFGPKSFSPQAAFASVVTSIWGIWFWIVMIRIFLKAPNMPSVPEITVAFLALAAWPFLFSRLGWVGLIVSVFFLASPLHLIFKYAVANQKSAFVNGSLAGFALSIVIDMAALWLLRRFLSNPLARMLLLKILLASFALIACAIGLPVFLLVRFGSPNLTTTTSLGVFMFLFNLSDLTAFLLLVGLALIPVIHHLFWPFVKRPLYGLQRFSVFSHRKLFCTLGAAFFLLGLGAGQPSLVAAWNIVKKALSI